MRHITGFISSSRRVLQILVKKKANLTKVYMRFSTKSPQMTKFLWG
jgi:hypothetical protein